MKLKEFSLASIFGAVLLLTVGIIGCGDDPTVAPMNALSNISVGGVNGEMGLYCTTLFAGQDIDAGTVCAEVIDNGDTEELCITYTTTGGWELVEAHLWVGEALADMPQTRKGNPKVGNFPYHSGDITGATTYTFCVDLAAFGGETDLCDAELLAAAHAVVRKDNGDGTYQTETGWGDGDRMVERGNWATFFSIQFTCGGGNIPGVQSETAFAYNCDDMARTCFIGMDDGAGGTFNRWGWTNGPLGPGTYYFDIYAGAGRCELANGTLVGLLTVDYNGAAATVTYETCGFYTMTETHLYVGNEMLARDVNDEFTVAPGQYPYIHENLADVQSDSYTVPASGEIYVVAHAVVWGNYDADGDCGERGCVPPVVPCTEWIVYGSNLNAGADLLDDAIYAYDLNADPITRTLVYDPTPIDGSQNYPNANAYDPDNNRIYFGTDDGRLFYHQIGSGTHVQVEGGATSGSFGTMACGAWYNGKFYYVQNGTNRLYEVTIVADVATRTEIGTVPTSNGYGDLAFDPANPGVFIASAGSVWYWYDIGDNSKGTLTLQGDNPGNHLQLAYGSNGVLYGVEATSGQFYTVEYDAVTVTTTLFKDTPFTYTDLASGPQCQ